MARQPEDTKTMDLIPMPKRGRPPTGKAMSAAERKRRQRERDAKAVWAAEVEEGAKRPEEMTLTALVENLRGCVTYGHPGMARRLADELVRRAEAENK